MMETHLLSPCPAFLHVSAFFLNFRICLSDLKPSQVLFITNYSYYNPLAGVLNQILYTLLKLVKYQKQE